MTLWSHHVTSRVTVTEIDLNSGAIMNPKKTDNAKKLTADARAKHFWVYCFWALGRSIIYVCGDMFITLPFCLYLNLSITWSSASMTKSPVFLKEETHSPEREVKNIYLNFVKPICFWASLNFNQTKNNI